MNIKFIWFIFIGAIISGSCTTASSKSYVPGSSGFDTTFSSSTKQLRSDKIPDSIFQMTHLRHLSISGMDCDYSPHPGCLVITKLPEEIKNLKELTSLSLTLSGISVIPDELTELKNLKFIDLSDGSLSNSNLDNLTRIKSLEYLYMHGCGLTKLPADIGNLVKLKELGLSGNSFDKTEQARIKKELPKCIIIF